MYADKGNYEDGLGGEEIVKGVEMGVSTGANEFVCGDEIGEEDVFVIADETWSTGRGKEVKEGRRMEKRTEMGLQ